MKKLSEQLLAFSILLTTIGCQTGSTDVDLTLTQTPPPVQAAFMKSYEGATLKQVTRNSHGNQDYYTFKFTSVDGKEKTVEMNEAGDEVASH